MAATKKRDSRSDPYPHPILSWLHGVLSAYWIFIVVVLSSFLLNIAQLLCHALLFLDYRTRLSYAQRLADHWWVLFPFVTEVWSCIPYYYTGHALQSSDDAVLFLGNHAAGIDFTSGISVSCLPGGPGTGHVMTYMKQSLAYVPTIGFTHRLQGSIFLKRSWEADEEHIYHKLEDMREGRFPTPFWIGVYPEGTRLTPEKYAASLQFAKERHLPPLQHLLIPRTKGFTTLLSALKKKLTAVYDATCAYESSDLFLSHPFIYGRYLTTAIHIHIHRTDIHVFNNMDIEAQQQWLYQCWQKKDKFLEYYQQHKQFPATGSEAAQIEGSTAHHETKTKSNTNNDSHNILFKLPGRERYHHFTERFIIWSVLVTLSLSLFFTSWLWLVCGLFMTAFSVARPMILGGLYGVFGSGILNITRSDHRHHQEPAKNASSSTNSRKDRKAN